MLSFRPVAYILGLLIAALGISMLLPMAVDIIYDNGHWIIFLEIAIICFLFGTLVALTSASPAEIRLSRQQSFFLTTSVWAVLPLFGSLPFLLGAPQASFVDALFEAMSGFTTTGSTVFSSLESLPNGIKLWRAMTQWFGGIGIIIVAMVFLPKLRIGGMQIFSSEGFDADAKILPRIVQIAARILGIYIALTALCALVYTLLGMIVFDATVHAMTTIATGGFANYDNSFAAFSGAICYASTLFMILSALPFVRYIQLANGQTKPLLRDPQIRGFLLVIITITIALFYWQFTQSERPLEPAIRHALFNTFSLITGTGYASDDYNSWGGFAVVILFFAGLIGGCAGSTSCSIKIFRYQLLFASLRTEIQKINWPNGVFLNRYNGQRIEADTLNSVTAFFVLFLITLIGLAILLSLSGLDYITALSGAATALANIGPGFGEQIGPTGNFSPLNSTAKWLLIGGMLIGRLELLAIYVMFVRRFWSG